VGAPLTPIGGGPSASVLAFECRVRRLTGDAELAQARARFDAVGPRAEALRDLVAHLDEYAVGKGRRQTGEAEPPITDPYVKTFISWTNSGGTVLDLAGEWLNLRTVANAAVKLAEVVERVRRKHLERAERETDAALRRMYGLVLVVVAIADDTRPVSASLANRPQTALECGCSANSLVLRPL
jgi:hypothetical protein